MINYIKKHNYICLSVMIIITCLLLYRKFLFGSYVLAYNDWGYDTFHQYIPVYQFYTNLIKNGNFSLYSFAYGLGTSVFTSLSWIADPFSILNVIVGIVFGIEKIPSFLVYNQILKIVFSGILCFYYLKKHGFVSSASMIAAYCFAFSGYMMTTGQHYFFSIYPIYFLLLLIFIDKTIYDPSKGYQLVFISMLIAIRSPYSAYMIYLAGALYVICMSVYVSPKIIATIKKVLYNGIMMVAGLSLGMFMFLPQAEVILQSPRISESQSIIEKIGQFMQVAPIETLRTGFFRLFSNHLEGTVNSWQGIETHFEAFPYFFSTIFVLFLVQYIVGTFRNNYSKKKKVFRIISIILLGISCVTLFVPAMFNLFVEPQYRFMFVILPMFAYIMADSLNNIICYNQFSRCANWCVVTIVTLSLMCYYRQQVGNEFICLLTFLTIVILIVGAVLLDILFISNSKKEINTFHKIYYIVYSGLMLLIFINMFYENSTTLYYDRNIVERSVYKEMNEGEYAAGVIDIKESEEDNFCRMETDFHIPLFSDAMFGSQNYTRTLSVYDPTCNSSVSEFLSKMYGNTSFNQQIYYLGSYGVPSESINASILGIKYLLTTRNIQMPGWSLFKQYGETKLYQNNQIETAGILYNSYIIEENADKQSVGERQKGMAQRVILDAESEDVKEYGKEQKDVFSEDINDIFLLNDIEGENINFKVKEELNCINIKGKNFGESKLIIPLDVGLLDSEKLNQLTVISENGRVFEAIYAINSNGEYIRVDSQLYASGVEENEKCVYTYCIPADITSLELVFMNECKEFELSTIKAEAITVNYINSGVSLHNDYMGNIINGSVCVEDNSILFMPIPYEDDWQATIDGEETDIYKANYGFCAILVPKGTHEINMKYVSKTFQIGAIISLVSAVGVMLFFTRKDKKWLEN